MYDVDGNNKIDRPEFADIIASLGFDWTQEKCDSTFSRLGSQEDGGVGYVP